MATPDWIDGPGQIERFVGEGHPLFQNTKDRCGQTIQAMLDVEHTNSTHDARTTGLSGEIDTFVGNGAGRTISLSNAGLIPKMVYLWGAIDTTERVSNGGFETDMTDWSFTGDGSATGGQAGGQSGNCCAIANNGTAPDYIQQDVPVIPGRRYTFSVYYKDGTVTSGSGWTDLSGAHTGGANFTTGAAWVQQSESFTATTKNLRIKIANNENVQNGTILIDTCSVVEITGSDATRIDNMPALYAQSSRYRQVSWTNYVLANFTTGSFDIGIGAPNQPGETIYYFVLGIDTDTVPTGDTGAGSDPDWITSSILNRIIADDTGTLSTDNIANYIESQIWTQFIEEHNTDGTHSVTLQHVRIDPLSWSGNDADDRIIVCNLSDFNISHIEVYVDGSPVASKTSDMAGDTTKDEDAAALAANMIQDITINGQVEVGTDLNTSGNTYYAIAIGV